MSSQKAKINTLLFYHWDNTLFDSMLLPDGLDRDLVVQSILLETSDFPVIITDLETLRVAIFVWSSHRVDVWQHLLETTHYIYNPIENYNRLEHETTLLQKTGTGTIKGDGGNDTITYNLADSMEEDSSTTDTIRENVNTDIDVSSQKNNSIVSSGSDSTANTGTDIRAVTDVDTETNTGTDTETVSGSESRSKTGYDETSEGVSAFNEQSVFSDHTRTRTDYNSGDSATTNTTKTIDFGKETVNDRSINEQFTNGKISTTTYGKTETETGTGTETTEEERLTTADNHSISSRSGSGTKTGTETHTHEQGNIETRNFEDSYTADRHISGNIGVTTTQDMIKQEREIALFDIIDVIVADYKNEFCIQIY